MEMRGVEPLSENPNYYQPFYAIVFFEVFTHLGRTVYHHLFYIIKLKQETILGCCKSRGVVIETKNLCCLANFIIYFIEKFVCVYI